MAGWQEYQVTDGRCCGRSTPPPSRPPPPGCVGMPGVTAWYGLTRIGKPRPGDGAGLGGRRRGRQRGRPAGPDLGAGPWELPAARRSASTSSASWASTPASTTSGSFPETCGGDGEGRRRPVRERGGRCSTRRSPHEPFGGWRCAGSSPATTVRTSRFATCAPSSSTPAGPGFIVSDHRSCGLRRCRSWPPRGGRRIRWRETVAEDWRARRGPSSDAPRRELGKQLVRLVRRRLPPARAVARHRQAERSGQEGQADAGRK